ncbi:MAG: hypothetical protein AB7K24_16185 [Gemmataceae bacterium]
MMRIKAGLGAIAITMLLAGMVRSQDAYAPQPSSGGETAPMPAEVDTVDPYGYEYADTFMPETRRARGWMHKYNSCACDAPIGLDGPILMEIYLQNGVSQPLSGGFLNNRLAAGWIIQGGGRSLFFNPVLDRAWVVDLSVANVCNNGNQPTLIVPFNGGLANVRNMNRTYVSVGLGREWYLMGTASADGPAWRAGCDFGGQYGTARIDFNTNTTVSGFARTNDIFGGMYVAAHTDFEMPWRCCVWFVGYRMEWNYQWLDEIGVEQNDNLANLNMLLNLGVRY